MPDYWAFNPEASEAWKKPAIRRWEYAQYIQGKADALLEELIRLNPRDSAAERRELAWRRQGDGGPFR